MGYPVAHAAAPAAPTPAAAAPADSPAAPADSPAAPAAPARPFTGGADAVLMEGGVDRQQGVKRGGAVVQWDWRKHLWDYRGWFLSGNSEANIGYWEGPKGRTGNGSLLDFGFSPLIFRFEKSDALLGFLVPFVDAGIGLHGFTEDRIANKNFGLNFSFGEWLGAGVRFGEKREVELGYRFQHLSNAGLGSVNGVRANPGIDFHLVQLGYHF
jgi:hypothetical protein